MKTDTYHLTFITPCFCAGATPEAELRPASIRGELRWWYRALGGQAEEERLLFGGISRRSGDKNHISKVIVRVKQEKTGDVDWQLPEYGPNDNESYVWHFAKVSGVDKGLGMKSGPRWEQSSFLPPRAKFSLQILYREAINDPLFEKALTCFLQLGSLGLRSTRGLGAFTCDEEPFDKAGLMSILNACGCKMESLDSLGGGSVYEIARSIGKAVKILRKGLGWESDKPSPLGCSDPRLTSVIHFRPVCLPVTAGNKAAYRIVAYESLRPSERNRLISSDSIVGQIQSLLERHKALGESRRFS